MDSILLDGPFVLELPFPPTTNTYYRSNRGRVHISDRGLAFKAAVRRTWESQGRPRAAGRVCVGGLFVAPDRRRRDLDNVFGKALFDSLKGLAFGDDSQIYAYGDTRWLLDDLGRISVCKNGKLFLRITPLPTPVAVISPKRAGARP